jgi:hypothetical protein
MSDLKNLHRAYKRDYARLVGVVSTAIDRADPIGLLAMGCPADEYAPEVGTIIPRLNAADSAEDVQTILYEEFVRWFGEAGPRELYKNAADEVWKALSEFHRTTSRYPDAPENGSS